MPTYTLFSANGQRQLNCINCVNADQKMSQIGETLNITVMLYFGIKENFITNRNSFIMNKAITVVGNKDKPSGGQIFYKIPGLNPKHPHRRNVWIHLGE